MTIQDRLLAAWEACEKLRERGYCGIQLEVRPGHSSKPVETIVIGAQAATEDHAQSVADLLGIVLTREFRKTLGWFEYGGKAAYGDIHIYAVRDVPGCAIVRNPTPETISWTEYAYEVQCTGGPATLVPSEE